MIHSSALDVFSIQHLKKPSQINWNQCNKSEIMALETSLYVILLTCNFTLLGVQLKQIVPRLTILSNTSGTQINKYKCSSNRLKMYRSLRFAQILDTTCLISSYMQFTTPLIQISFKMSYMTSTFNMTPITMNDPNLKILHHCLDRTRTSVVFFRKHNICQHCNRQWHLIQHCFYQACNSMCKRECCHEQTLCD